MSFCSGKARVPPILLFPQSYGEKHNRSRQLCPVVVLPPLLINVLLGEGQVVPVTRSASGPKLRPRCMGAPERHTHIHQHLFSVTVAVTKVCSLFWWINLHPQGNLILPSSSRNPGLRELSSLICARHSGLDNQTQRAQLYSACLLIAAASIAFLLPSASARMHSPVVFLHVAVSLVAKHVRWISCLWSDSFIEKNLSSVIHTKRSFHRDYIK